MNHIKNCSKLLVVLSLSVGITVASAILSNNDNEDDKSTSSDEIVSYVTTENFKAEVLDSKIPVLVDFTATWCAPCKVLDPTIDSLMPEMSGRAKVFKLDIDESPEIFSKYQLSAVPTVMFFNNGIAEDQITGPQSREVYVKLLEGMIDGTSAFEVRIALLDDDSFRRDFILKQRLDVIQAAIKHRPNLLSENFENGQSPLAVILNSRAGEQDERISMILAEDPILKVGDLVGLGRCDEFNTIVRTDPDAVNRPDSDGNTPLLTALIQDGRLKESSCVRAVLDAGADPGQDDQSSFTLGRAAVSLVDAELLEELLEKGLNPNRTDADGRNALHWAAVYGYPPSVKVLLDQGVDPSIQALNSETAVDIVREKRDMWLTAARERSTVKEVYSSVLDPLEELLTLLGAYTSNVE